MSVSGRSCCSRCSPVRSWSSPVSPTAVAGLDSVIRVDDTGDIPRGLPVPSLPHLSDFSATLLVGAAAIAAYDDATTWLVTHAEPHDPT